MNPKTMVFILINICYLLMPLSWYSVTHNFTITKSIISVQWNLTYTEFSYSVALFIQAPPENRLVASPVSAIKKSTIKTTASTTFAIKNKESKHSITPKDEVKVALDSKDEGRSSTQSFSEEVEQTPPSKEEEFNKFKKGRGQKIHENFLNNKGIEMCVQLIRVVKPSHILIGFVG